MSMRPWNWWGAVLLASFAAASSSGCSRTKQVPFGLEDAGTTEEHADGQTMETAELPVGRTFEPDQVEIPVGESTLALPSGYALAALEIELDGTSPVDTIAISADGREIGLQAAFQRGLGVVSRSVDSFLVAEDCTNPSADIRQLSDSLVSARVDHDCERGTRTNVWLVTVETQPRVRERITVLPANDVSTAEITLGLQVDDRDADGYEDVVATLRIDDVEVPLVWLNRPGGFSRDASQPEAAFRLLADDAWAFLDSDPSGSERRARGVLEAFVALCRESGAARIGLAGTQGIQCKQSQATARAVAVAIVAALRRGTFIRALELQRWWQTSAMLPTAEEQALVQNAWKKAKARAQATWRLLAKESSKADLYFSGENTLIVDGVSPKSIDLDTGAITRLDKTAVAPPVRDPDGQFAVRGVRVTCAGYEAEIGPVIGRRTSRVLIERRPGTEPCRTPVDRPANTFEWEVLGWAPQGLVAAVGDRLRVVPLDEKAKPAGGPIDLSSGSPLPAPVRGARITPDGARYVIPHPEGVVVRDWRAGGAGAWLRPPDWGSVPGELRSLAISPSGSRVAVQKGNQIRMLSW